MSTTCLERPTMLKGRFRLDVTVPALPSHPGNQDPALSDNAYVNFRVSLPLSELTAKETPSLYGGFVSDSLMPKYNMLWGSRRDFELFLVQEQSLHSVEFVKSQTTKGISGKYLARESYLCARHGRSLVYVKKNPHWGRKVPSKVTHCSASLTIKSYPGTSFILGIYDSEHNHPLGNENLWFTRISPSTREWIAGMLRLNVKTDHVVNILACFYRAFLRLTECESLHCYIKERALLLV